MNAQTPTTTAVLTEDEVNLLNKEFNFSSELDDLSTDTEAALSDEEVDDLNTLFYGAASVYDSVEEFPDNDGGTEITAAEDSDTIPADVLEGFKEQDEKKGIDRDNDGKIGKRASASENLTQDEVDDLNNLFGITAEQIESFAKQGRISTEAGFISLKNKSVVLSGKPPKSFKKREVAQVLKKDFKVKEVSEAFHTSTDVVVYQINQKNTAAFSAAKKLKLSMISYEEVLASYASPHEFFNGRDDYEKGDKYQGEVIVYAGKPASNRKSRDYDRYFHSQGATTLPRFKNTVTMLIHAPGDDGKSIQKAKALGIKCFPYTDFDKFLK